MAIDVLVVAEKDSVARAIAHYLAQGVVNRRLIYGVKTYWFMRNGAQWVSIGLRGHVMNMDFPVELNQWHSVEPGKLLDVEPILVIREENVNYARALMKLASGVKTVILALDADSEGEAIAYEALFIIKNVNPRATFKRALFSAVTKQEITRAFNDLRELNPGLAKRVFTRMALDLTLGAVFTRALTLSVERLDRNVLPRGSFLSYGPCQTPVLNLVVQRALERENFKPEKYYVVLIEVRKGGNSVQLTLNQEIKDKATAQSIVNSVRSEGKGVVTKALYREGTLDPPVPLDTIELERRASRFFNIRSKAALDIAEELYRHGLISYPRTETTIYPQSLDLKGVLNDLLGSDYGDYVRQLLSKPLKPTRGDSDDGAHPPIYPTSGATKEKVLRLFKNERYWRIYDLVVRHFLATLSPPATVERQELSVRVGKYEFRTNGLKIVNPGYLIIYPFEKPSERVLPRFSQGEEVIISRAWLEEKETEPPPYLSESELLRLMKKYGIGTDATMQDHIHTNIVRGYFRVRNKQCIPTPLGKAVIGILSSVGKELIDPWFRARMEKSLMEITRGHLKPEDVLITFKNKARNIYKEFMANNKSIGESLIKALKDSLGKGKGA
ncbi:DNA topoisomerase [Vulcanisaeta thermophila]|uniref:DNA topoisomerase n=1 Tax=Vulcanisaeta thermophila TaxID=867917 RepID=UPI0008534DE0|nr:DNA topoisomerase [Vulcanisaeta thermophila]